MNPSVRLLIGWPVGLSGFRKGLELTFQTNLISSIEAANSALHNINVCKVMEFVDLLKNPEKYKEMGAKPPKGALLLGRINLYSFIWPLFSVLHLSLTNFRPKSSVLRSVCNHMLLKR